ncbi:hypothetical protein L195_g030758 [Trifolium pratense]|uniref:Uncharacterized protein n=1 Tax=Trifolium pratense TaxID=57577 RepID=A0A2K3L8G3_TRIPR|nr:hypothetical protein L195_g030758 [Trifolium pratense]
MCYRTPSPKALFSTTSELVHGVERLICDLHFENWAPSPETTADNRLRYGQIGISMSTELHASS